MHSFSTIPITRPQKRLAQLVAPWAVALVALALTPGLAHAQTEETTAIPVQQYEPGPGAEDIMGLQSSYIQKHMEWQLGWHLNFADDVLEFRTLDANSTIARIIESQTGIDLMAAIGFKDRFELGLVVPITPYRTHGNADALDLAAEDLSSAALGDIRLVPKVRLYGRDQGTGLALSVPITLPSGKDTEFYGEGSLGIEPRFLVDYTFAGGTRIGLNLGIRFHPTEKKFANLEIGHELTYGLGVRVPFQLARKDFAAVATLIGSHVLAVAQPEERPRELLGGLEYHPNESFTLRVGAGPGLSRGYGTPDFRVLFGVAYRHRPAERPPCPYGPEDEDGYQDDDQCADPDNDSDGIEDALDLCPNEPELVNQVEDDDGCPEHPADLEPDSEPLPALEAPKDPDGDGLFDEDDLCPDQPEDQDSFNDLDGCPDPDNDSDSILDQDDKCPLEAEVINGTDDQDGCPDEGKALVDVTDKEIKILEPVYFDTAKATIQERSYPLLDQVAAILEVNPRITKVRVEGHTDDRGKDAYNLKLSDDRANAVREYLMNKGIAGERLEAEGFGETRPIDTNKTKKGRANNRRVQFVIVEINGQPVSEDAAGNTVETEK